MDPVSAWIADRDNKIPVGDWGRQFFDFLTDNFEWFFDSVADGLTAVLDGVADLLLLLPPVLVVLLIAAFAWWLKKSWKLALGVALGLLFIINQDLWKETIETLVRAPRRACSSAIADATAVALRSPPSRTIDPAARAASAIGAASCSPRTETTTTTSAGARRANPALPHS